MIVLNATASTTEVLKAMMTEAASTLNPICTVTWFDENRNVTGPYRRPLMSNTFTQLSGTTEVTIAAAPATDKTRKILRVVIPNQDTIEHEFTLFIDDGTNRIQKIKTCAVGESLIYESGVDGRGRYEDEDDGDVIALATVGDGTTPPLIPGDNSPLSMTTDGRLRVTTNGDAGNYFDAADENMWGGLQTEYKFSGSVWSGW